MIAINSKAFAFFGTYTNTKSQGIGRIEIDIGNGAAGDLQTAAQVENPSFLTAASPNHLLSCVESEYFQGELGGGVISFRIETDGSLTSICAENTRGTYPCHVCVGEKNRTVFISNYGSGSFSIFKMDIDGKLFFVKTICHEIQGVNGTQQSPHAHCCMLTKDEQTLYVCDMGIDRVMVYDLSKGVEFTALKTEFVFPVSSGPRHMVFSSDECLLYVVCELSNEVVVLSVENGEILQKHTIVPKNTQGFAAASAIYLCKNANLLAVSVRGVDSIQFFIVRENGLLDKSAVLQLKGKYPRDMYLSPDGARLLVAYEKSDYAELLQLDPFLNCTVLSRIEIPAPTRVCLVTKS